MGSLRGGACTDLVSDFRSTDLGRSLADLGRPWTRTKGSNTHHGPSAREIFAWIVNMFRLGSGYIFYVLSYIYF